MVIMPVVSPNFELFRCGLLVFALLKLCRYHQQENIRVSAFPLMDFFVNDQICR